MRSFPVHTVERECLVDVTRQVARLVAEDGVAEGLCMVCVPHTTAGVTINESADPDVARDLLSFLAGAVPLRGPYRHVEGNSNAHIKASLLGSSAAVPVSQGRLVLGTWQGLFLAEFDGPRQRMVHVVVVRG
jgi:secondary thiamine-phosphate synthase enzyme